MNTQPNALRLCIYSLENDKSGHVPLHERLVAMARDRGLAGATVLRGIMGYGASHHLHSTKVLQLANDLPVLTEFIDEPSRIREFVEEIRPLIASAHATLEPVEYLP